MENDVCILCHFWPPRKLTLFFVGFLTS